jgi:predicted aspartyl protease
MPHLILSLQRDGAILPIGIGVSEERKKILESDGLPVGVPIHVRGLIDTGASGTCVDERILKKLGLTPSGSVSIHTPSTKGVAVDVDQYDVSIVLFDQHEQNLSFGTIPVIESTFDDCEILIGRDILQQVLLIYDGIAGQFTVAF